MTSSSDSAAPKTAVSLRGLWHRYGDRVAVRDLSLEVVAGEIFGLLGPNGGGKSTTFGVLSTLLPTLPGHCRVMGLDPGVEPDAVRQRIGVVFQDRSLDGKLTVRENLRHAGHLYGLGGSALGGRIDRALERFGLGERAGDRVETLSGGLARRVELAKGMLHEPDVLLLDEPSTGLDPAGRRDLWDQLARLKDEGVTVLVTTHLMEEAERCDRLAILSRGRCVALGRPEELKAEVARDVVTLECEDPTTLASVLERELGIAAEPKDGAVRWESEDGAQDVARALGAYRQALRAVHVTRPSLEDVFLHRTGRSFAEDEQMEEAEGATTPEPAESQDSHTTPSLARGGIWRPALSLAARELLRFSRQRSRIVGSLATPLLFWLMLGSGLGRSFRPEGWDGGGYLDFFYPGMLALTVLFTAIFSTISIIEDRHEGFLQSVLVAPVSRSGIVLGKILGGAALGLIQGALLLAVAPLVGYPLTLPTLAAAFGVLGLTALALTGLGFALAWKIDSSQGYHSAMNMLLFPMWLLSGALFPAVDSSAWVGWIMRINPLSYGLSALRHALGSPMPGDAAPSVALGVIALFGVAMFALSLVLVRGRSRA